MKRVLACLIIGIILIGACKKEDNKNTPSTPGSNDCLQTTLFDTIPNPILSTFVVCFTEDEENRLIYLLRDNSISSSQYYLVKLDTNLNESWTIPINVSGRAIDLTHDNDNNYYVISQNQGHIETGSSYYENVFFMYRYNFIDCYPVYDLIDVNLTSYEEVSTTQVQKYSNSGNLLWSQEFKGTAPEYRKNLEILSSGEAILATYDFPNLNFDLVYRDGVFQDTINIADSTYLHVYKISSSGVTTWNKDILIPTQYYDGWLEYGQYGTSLYVTFSDTEIIVTALNTIHILNGNGEIIKDYNISSNHCIDLFLCSSLSISKEMVVLCSYPGTSLYTQWPQYLAKYQTSNELNWITDIESSRDLNLILYNDGTFIYQTGHIITKYNNSGTILWQQQFPQYSMPPVKANCLNGYTVVKSISIGDQRMLVIIRTDENGDF